MHMRFDRSMNTHSRSSLLGALALCFLVLGCEDEAASEAGSDGGGGSGANGTGLSNAGGSSSSSVQPTGGSSSTGPGEPECTGDAYDSCSPCCEALHPAGVAKYAETLNQCACGFGICQFSCGEFCASGVMDAACMEMAAFDFNSPGYSNSFGGGNFGACAADSECTAYATCLNVCTVGRGPIAPPAAGASPQDKCVHYVNAYRDWEGKPPLARWTEGEACADQQVAIDEMNGPHSSFGMCGEATQNECLGFNPDQIGYCQAMMYSEKFTGEQGMGHYLAMTGAYSKVACGFTDNWSNQNYQ